MDLGAQGFRPRLPAPAKALAAACSLAAAAFLGGCATRTGLYDWGGYEDSLYLRYAQKDFATAETEVYRMLPQAGTTGRVPPGVYADYGFLLYRRGDHGGAIAYFEKEKQAFPESTLLMNKLIERIRQKDQTPGAAANPVAAPAAPQVTGMDPAPPAKTEPAKAPEPAAPPAAPGGQP